MQIIRNIQPRPRVFIHPCFRSRMPLASRDATKTIMEVDEAYCLMICIAFTCICSCGEWNATFEQALLKSELLRVQQSAEY